MCVCVCVRARARARTQIFYALSYAYRPKKRSKNDPSPFMFSHEKFYYLLTSPMSATWYIDMITSTTFRKTAEITKFVTVKISPYSCYVFAF